MSSYNVVAAVSQALRTVLWEAIDADPQVRPLVGTEDAIVFVNPEQTSGQTSNRLSLWLYQITENEFVKNQPMLRGNGNQTQQFPPLALNFFYLLTPFGTSGAADHLILGKAMQVMYDNAVLLLSNDTEGTFEELRIVFCRLTLEELTRIWEALRFPYRLSVCYQVKVTRIESGRGSSGARIVSRQGDLARLAAESNGA